MRTCGALQKSAILMQTKTIVAADGTPLTHRLFTSEPKSDRVAFFAHSKAQHTLNLRPTIEGIAANGWTVHATDLRGHGHSSGSRAPLGHMEIDRGWERLIEDMTLGLRTAFEGVSWENRMIVAPNIGALLTLEVLKDWPDLAQKIVLATPPPNQPALMKLARSFVKARTFFHPPDKPDELTMHQLYTFLGARLSDRKRLIDVISSDRAITDALEKDEYAWPTPTTGYFHEMFRGVESAWNWPRGQKVRQGTDFFILYGGDDPMTANGRFVDPMRRHLIDIGARNVDAHCVEKGRSGLIIEEERFGVSGIIESWASGLWDSDQNPVCSSRNDGLAAISSGVLEKLGLTNVDGDLSTEELVELCYNAIDDESRWIEMLYRVTYALSSDVDMDERHLETIVLALMPHWDRSFQLNRQIMQSAAIGAVLQNVIDRFSIGMAVVSADMSISFANSVFRSRMATLAESPDLLTTELDVLTENLRKYADREFVQRCRTGSGEALFMIDGNAVGLHFRPQALRQTALQRDGASGVLILRAHQQGADNSNTALVDLLQFAYGLTAKEAEAALCLIDGLSPDAIAKRCAVSVNTTRTHLKRIYEKVGVKGQTELTASLLKGPVGLIVNR